MNVTNPETASYAFDILGRDLPTAEIGTTETEFCVNYRLQWLVPQALPLEPGLIRADIRVLWPRGFSNNPSSPDVVGPGWCNATTAQQINPDPNFDMYHVLYLTTDIRQGSQ
jgi:hypothetical protein